MSDPEQPRDDDNDGVAVPMRRRRAQAEGPASKKGLLLVMALVGVGASVVTLALAGFKDNAAVYSKPVDELLAQKTKFVGRAVRAEGTMVPGSLKHQEKPCEYRFMVEKNGQAMPVRFGQCVVPDNFQDIPGMPVSLTVEGELGQSGTFEATAILTKCPSKYEEKEKAGEKNPHLLTGAAEPKPALMGAPR